MKIPFTLERILQFVCLMVICWAMIFMVGSIFMEIPDTTINRMESRGDGDSEKKAELERLVGSLEMLRNPGPLLSLPDQSGLRDIFTPYKDEKVVGVIACAECGTDNPGDALVCFNCGAILLNPNLDRDGDAMPDYWEIKYELEPEDPADAQEDEDGDGYLNLEEFQNGTNPLIPEDEGTSMLPFGLVKVYKKPIQIQLMGYLVLPEGHYEVQINWAGVTEFYKIGDEIRGFVIKDFKKMITETTSPTGVIIYEDKSFILCQRKKFEPKKFIKGQIVNENETYAKVQFTDTKKVAEVYLGAELEDPSTEKTYKVNDIHLKPAKLVIEDADGREYILRRSS